MTYTLDDARHDLAAIFHHADVVDGCVDCRRIEPRLAAYLTTQADTIAAKDAEIERLTAVVEWLAVRWLEGDEPYEFANVSNAEPERQGFLVVSDVLAAANAAIKEER